MKIIKTNELYVANMIKNKLNGKKKGEGDQVLSNFKDRVKTLTSDLSQDLKGNKKNIYNIFSKQEKREIFSVCAPNVDFPFVYNLYNLNIFNEKTDENKGFVPYKIRKIYKVEDSEKFIDFFGEEEAKRAGSVKLNSKKILSDVLGIKSTSSYEEIIDKMPADLKNIIKLTNKESINFKRNAISWSDAVEIIEKNKDLSFFYEKAEKVINNNNYEYIEDSLLLQKELNKFLKTGKVYLFNTESPLFDSSLLTVTKREGVSYNKDELAKIAEQNSNIYSFLSASYEVNQEIKSLIKFYGNIENSGISESNVVVVMSSILKNKRDIDIFIKEVPENFYYKKMENETEDVAGDYNNYLQNKLKR